MFGETDSESPRMPSPWEALSVAPSPAPSPLMLSAFATSNNSATALTDDTNLIDPGAIPDTRHDITNDRKYLDVARASAIAPSGLSSSSTSPNNAFPKLAPEVEEGNVEYKLKLIDPSPSRFARLVTQLKYRLLEGGGQALYEIGVSDFGDLVGLSRNDLEASLDTLDRMAGELGATVVVLKEIELPKGVSGKLPGAQVGFAMGPQEQPQPYIKTLGKKDRDKEARRVRRAAALVADVVNVVAEDNADTMSTISGGEHSPFQARSQNPHDNPDDAASDLSRTITLSPPSVSTIPANHSTQPMPIITNYPYGRRPFATSKPHPTARSVSSNGECGSTSSFSTTGSFTSVTKPSSFDGSGHAPELDGDEYVYMPASGCTGSDDCDNRVSEPKRDENDDPVFDFAFDIEIASFPAVAEPSPLPKLSKPLHYSSFAARSGEDEQLHSQRPAEDPSSFANLRLIKSPRPKKKPIIPTPPIQDPAEKAAGKRQKRDARREERQRQQMNPSSKERLSAPIDPPTPADSVDSGPVLSDHAFHKPKELGPRVIAEALVVRKLALDEAFLDFGGFSLVETLAGSLSVA
ncbi:hypothetical protein FRB93_007048 [Tulasnella sp. JGI-2019a]|nr:hypothetical protein FRB93_007048 [Tulasnella sp. JGI-2019a]